MYREKDNDPNRYKQLFERLPFLDTGVGLGYCEPGDSWHEYLPMGWQSLFLDLCDIIAMTLKHKKIDLSHFRLQQVKEKFGEMRIYWSFQGPSEISNQIDEMVDTICHLSGRLCCQCGKPAQYQSKGWVCPYCHDCAVEWAKDRYQDEYKEEIILQQFTEMWEDYFAEAKDLL